MELSATTTAARAGTGRTAGLADLPRRRGRGRQDVRHALRGPPAPERGADVVVAFVETHGRVHTAELLDGLEVMPRARIGYRGTIFEEMDLDAVLARKPQIALVDEFAHTNVPGSRNAKRWQDVEELLDAGIDVISTRQHPAPGVAQRRGARRSPACRSGRPCPTPWSAPPTRSSSST